MNERETTAVKAGLKDMSLLRLYGDDVPIDTVLADLRGRFGQHPSAFVQPTLVMPRADYRTARAAMLEESRQLQRQRDPAPVVDARTLPRRDYAAARQAMLESVR